MTTGGGGRVVVSIKCKLDDRDEACVQTKYHIRMVRQGHCNLPRAGYIVR